LLADPLAEGLLALTTGVDATSPRGVVEVATDKEFPSAEAVASVVVVEPKEADASSERRGFDALEPFELEAVPSNMLLKRPTMSRRLFDCVGVVAGAVFLEPTSFDPDVGVFSERAPDSADR